MNRTNHLRLNTEIFVNRSNIKHNYKYSYANSLYTNVKTKIIIICPIHGEFLQNSQNHLQGCGCPKCAIILRGINNRLTINQFMKKAEKVHDYRYGYIDSLYINNITKIKITCPVHGEFYQTPNSHLSGCGCPKCNNSKGEISITNYLEINNIKFESQYKFKDCKNIYQLPFDFYLLDYRLLIEYDGEQHYMPWKNDGYNIKLDKTKYNDKIKNEYSFNNNIDLLRIKYTELDNIEIILKNKLLEYEK